MTVIPQPRPVPPKPIPPLQGGDHLTRDEFERRYDATPDLKKAELLDGVVYMPPPVSDEDHGVPHLDLAGWIAMYRFATPGVSGVRSRVPCGSIRTTDRSPTPCSESSRNVAAGPTATGPVISSPPRTSWRKLPPAAPLRPGAKLDVYRRFGVREYVIWRVYDVTVDWFVLRGNDFEHLTPGPDRIYRSEVFPGLWLDADALMRGDAAGLLRVAQQGLASPEHAAFVERLRQARTPGRP